MAATGKKSKKSKWIKTSITSIIAEPTTIPTTNNWSETVDDEPEPFGYASSRQRAPVVLPSASRAARGGMAVDDESIPRRPPYVAHISNLPYDIDESAITELFEGLKITNLRLPREGERLKGYGYVDFEDRESLIDAMNMPDLTIGGRRIRIEVSTQDNDRRMGRGARSDRDREYDPERTMGDWRSGPRAMPEPQSRSRNMDRERERDRGERDRERESSSDNRPGGWRDGERSAPAEPARAPYGGRDSYGRERFGEDRDRDRGRDRGYGGRDGFRTADREGFGGRESRGFGGSRGFGDRDRDPPPRDENKPRERPKLNLLPRTVPRETEAPTKPADGAPLEEKQPEKPAPKPVSAEKVFGAAKPVDTAAKEREIEERLRKQEEEARRGAEDKERWGRRNDHSGDRRPGARRDDRGRDSRSYNRDQRDYSKDDRERRDDGAEKRDYRDEDRDYDDRDRRDYTDDDRDKRDTRDRDRDYSNDRDGDRRENSGDRRESRERTARDGSSERLQGSADKDRARPDEEHNGRARSTGVGRTRDIRDEDDKPLPKLKEQEKPNFVASNKFAFLEAADDEGSD